MDWILILLGIFIVVAIFIAKLASQSQGQKSEYEYRKIGPLFTPAERSFLGVLKLVVNDDIEIFGKVRVADVITPQKNQDRSHWQRSFNKISAKHFDYVLCKKDDLTPVCAIELNDSSHNSKKRKERDEFLNTACRSANMPLVMIPAKVSYKASEVSKIIDQCLSEGKAVEVKEAKEDVESDKESVEKLCPKCSSVLALKVAKKGKNIGSEFWACSAFPRCRYIEVKAD